MITTVYDATNVLVDNIPLNAEGIAYYINGLYAWTPAQVAKFPNAKKITISITANQFADVLDVETGDATPADCPKAYDLVGQRGFYCNRSNWNDVLGELGPRPGCRFWIAWPNAAVIPAGANAVQRLYFSIYDVSWFDETWWSVPDPVIPEDLMYFVLETTDTNHAFFVSPNGKVYVDTPDLLLLLVKEYPTFKCTSLFAAQFPSLNSGASYPQK